RRVPPDIRRVEIRVVEGIEDLSTELHGAGLIDSEILRQVEIKVHEVRTAHDANAGIAERLWSRIEHGECVRVEPALSRPLRCGQHRITDQIWTGLTFAAKIQHRASAESHRQTKSSLCDVDSGKLPSAEHGVHGATPVLTEGAANAERQIVNVA